MGAAALPAQLAARPDMPGRLLEHTTALRKAIAGHRIPDKTWLFLVLPEDLYERLAS